MFLSNFEGGNSHVSYSPPTTPTIHTSSFASNGSSRNWSSIIGIVTAIIGNILISFALNTQRYAHIKLSRERDVELEKQKPKRDGITGYGTQQARIAEERAVKVHKTQQNGAVVDGQQDESAPLLGSGNGKTSTGSSDSSKSSSTEKSYLQSPWWWLGITLMVLGECGNFLAYGFAPASVVSPLGVVALVSNCLIAPLMLHERFRLRDALGVVIAVAGCVTVVLSAKGSNPRLGADEIWKLIATWEFETYLACTVILIVVLLWASTKYGDRTILIDLGLVGLFGGYTALSTKGIASLLSNTIWRVVTFPLTYLLLAILIITAVMQIKYVNRALQRFDSTQVIPTQFVLFTLSVIIGSAVLYRDFENRTSEDAAKFFGGCALTFLGVWCITSGRGKDQEGDEESIPEDDGEDDAVDLVDEEGQQPEIRERESMSADPYAPTRQESSQSGPLFKFTQHDDEDFDFGIRQESRPASINGATPLTTNPWQQSANDPRSPHNPATAAAVHSDRGEITSPRPGDDAPQMHATTSTPQLPTVSTLALPLSPRNRRSGPSSPELSHDALYKGHQDNEGGEHSTSVPGRSHFSSFGNNTFSGMLPPLTNPLSGSLSAVVAESLRRGADVAPDGSLRRNNRSLRQRRSQRRLPRHSVAEGADGTGEQLRPPTRRGVSDGYAPRTPTGGPSRGMGRSLSTAFGSLWSSRKDNEDGEEA